MPNFDCRRLVAICLALFALSGAANALAVDCGTFNFPLCSKAHSERAQYAGGFAPPSPFGGFGGGTNCRERITHTPVVLVHGNGDSAIGWDSPAPARSGKAAGASLTDELLARGYNDCEVFGVSYLDADRNEPADTANNFHQPAKYAILWQFIKAVKDYTGSAKVDIVGHSLGVSMSLAALDYYSDAGDGNDEKAWNSVRRFINIAGGIHGLNSCLWGILTAPTCQTEKGGATAAFYEFGFYPDLSWPGARNRWTAVHGEHSLREAPARHPEVLFYTIGAGRYDDIHCPLAPMPAVVDCVNGPLFAASANVRAQLDIGADPAPIPPEWAAAVDPQMRQIVPRDLGGIGHFGARNYAGRIVAQMLTSDCRGLACKGSYVGKVSLQKP
jgi:pimeloyl-ACP methyl ester carboxylesterase